VAVKMPRLGILARLQSLGLDAQGALVPPAYIEAFRVTDVEQFAQAEFPTRRVYGATDTPELRLITCGGAYDHTAGRYQDTVDVFAALAR
jgi:hypothetical protein